MDPQFVSTQCVLSISYPTILGTHWAETTYIHWHQSHSPNTNYQAEIQSIDLPRLHLARLMLNIEKAGRFLTLACVFFAWAWLEGVLIWEHCHGVQRLD